MAESPGVKLSEPAGRWVVGVTVAGSAVAMITSTVVNVALPAIGEDLQTDVAGLQWVVNSYLITLASLILLGGTLGDRFGRRRAYVVGLVGFAASSALCALAWNLPVLLIFRAAQGVAGALLTPGSLAVIQASFVPQDRPKAIGAWSALGGVAAALGPLLGGWLIDVASWRSVFWMMVPIASVVAVLARNRLPESCDETMAKGIDLGGAALAMTGLAGISYALLSAGDGSGPAPAPLAVGLVALALFIWLERRLDAPLLPPAIFLNTQFAAANAVTLVVYAALGGFFFLLVVQLQVVLGYTALQAGAATLPVTLVMLALSAKGGEAAQRFGPRRPIAVGTGLIAAGMLTLSFLGEGGTYLTGVLPGVTIFSLGLAATVAPVTATALGAVEPSRAGLASGVNNAVARTAQLLAVAVLPLAAGLTGDALRRPEVFAAGFTTAARITAGLASAGTVVALLLVRDEVLTAGEPALLPLPPDEIECRHCTVDGPPLVSERRA